jgi:hypothetical protein
MRMRSVFALAALAATTVLGGASMAVADDGPASLTNTAQQALNLPLTSFANSQNMIGNLTPSFSSPNDGN